jgi:hypothetical protein
VLNLPTPTCLGIKGLAVVVVVVIRCWIKGGGLVGEHSILTLASWMLVCVLLIWTRALFEVRMGNPNRKKVIEWLSLSNLWQFTNHIWCGAVLINITHALNMYCHVHIFIDCIFCLLRYSYINVSTVFVCFTLILMPWNLIQCIYVSSMCMHLFTGMVFSRVYTKLCNQSWHNYWMKELLNLSWMWFYTI